MEHRSFRVKRDFIEPIITIDNYIYDSLGASLPREILVPGRDWEQYNTGFEDQKKQGVETMGCTVFNTHDAIQRIGKRRYETDDNYSDRYGNIGCGTTQSGNSPHKVAENIRQLIGCIPETKLPFGNPKSWKEYMTPSPLPQRLLNIGSKWRQDAEFGHEWCFLPKQTLKEKQDRIWASLRYSPVSASVYGWRWNGQRYYKNPSDRDNHWTTIIGGKLNDYWKIDDTYPPYIKRLDWDYNFSYGKRYHYKLKKNFQEEEKGIMNKEQLDTIYKELLMRDSDPGGDAYKNYEEDFVRDELLKSKERKTLEKWVRFLRSVKLLKGK